MFCTQCGHQNPDDSRFCSHCGAAVSRPGTDRPVDNTSTISLTGLETVEPEGADGGTEGAADPGALEGLPPGSALLVVKRGPNAGSRFLLDAESTTAGRHPESDIFLDDVTVSRRHAEFVRQGAHYAVRDVGSLNGTYLNRQRIDEAVLGVGDEVQIGKYRLVFLAGRKHGEGA